MLKIKNTFFNQSFISINQISSLFQITYLFKKADHMKNVVENGTVYEPLKGKLVSILFYQPSTRTFTSFVTAAKRLGAYVVDIHGMGQYSSAVKGETLEDSIKTINQTTAANAIVLRHPDDSSSAVAKSVSKAPIINGGSGKAEHPTQALLDLYTIYSKFKRLDNLNVVMVGDLKYGRTVKSLAILLAMCGKNNKITFVSPKELSAPKDLIKQLSKKLTIIEKTEFNSSLKTSDVLYMTRVQKEWFEKEGKLEEYEQLKLKYILTRHMVGQMSKKSIIMHPLPRVGEIMQEVDDDARAYYFKQMRSGLYIRMALLESILMP